MHIYLFGALLFFIIPSYPMDLEKEDDALLQSVTYFYDCIHKTPPQVDQLIKESDEHDLLEEMLTPQGAPKALNAPWREDYTTSERSKQNGTECPFCYQCEHPEESDKDFFLDRGERVVSLLNKNPTSPLHFLILPAGKKGHVSELSKLEEKTRLQLFSKAALLTKRLEKELSIRGFNMFLNLHHRCSGASLPGHVHIQLLSQWQGFRLALPRVLAGELVKHERTSSFFKELKKGEWGSDVQKVYNTYGKAVEANTKRKKIQGYSPNDTCILCDYQKQGGTDSSPVLKNFKHWSVIFNLVSSSPGQLFIVHKNHQKKFSDLSEDELEEYSQVIAECEKRIKALVSSHGISVALDDGIASEQWSFDHSCFVSIYPRWDNETSSLALSSGWKMVSRSLKKLLPKFKEAFKK